MDSMCCLIYNVVCVISINIEQTMYQTNMAILYTSLEEIATIFIASLNNIYEMIQVFLSGNNKRERRGTAIKYFHLARCRP